MTTMAMIILPIVLLCIITLPHTTKGGRLNLHPSESGWPHTYVSQSTSRSISKTITAIASR